MNPTKEERAELARRLGIERCSHCRSVCPYCPRLLAVRPDLAWVPPADVPVYRPDPRLALIAACPWRGPVLPVSMQPECGCRELTECRAGKGARPGAVTLRECLACVGGT